MQTDWASGSQSAAGRTPRGAWVCLLSMVICWGGNGRGKTTTTATISKMCRHSLYWLSSSWLKVFNILCKDRLGKRNTEFIQNGFKQPLLRSQICSLFGYLPLPLHLTQFADCCDIFVIMKKCRGWIYCCWASAFVDECALSSSLSCRKHLNMRRTISFSGFFSKLTDQPWHLRTATLDIKWPKSKGFKWRSSW